MSDLKFCCLACGQHIAMATESAGQSFPCPNCQAELQVPGKPFAPCSVPQTPRPKLPRDPGDPSEALEKWKEFGLLVLMGIIAPPVMMVGAALCCVFGPLALVAIPCATWYGSFLFAGFCLERTANKRFWIYPLTSISCSLVGMVAQFLFYPPPQPSAEPTLGGSIAASYGGIVLILMIPLFFLPWVIGMIGAYRGCPADE